MSKVDDQKRYITLEDVRVSYKKKDDSIHLTSSDPDVAIEGFHMFLSKGTQTEALLRNLLEEAGVIRNAHTSAIELESLNPIRDSVRKSVKAPIITVTSATSGAGKTNTALNLAIQLAKFANPITKKRFKVVLVDFDTNDGQIGTLINRRDSTLMNVMIDKEQSNITNYVVENETLEIHSLLAPHRSKSSSLLTGDFYADSLNKLTSEFDIVIVDASYDSRMINSVFPISDTILCLMPAKVSGSFALNKWLDEIQEAGTSIDKVSFVVNASANNDKNAKALKFMQENLKNFKAPIAVLPINLELMEIDGTEDRETFLRSKNDYTTSLLQLAKQLANLVIS